MHYRITAISEFGKSILDSHTFAAVHSVYRKTINLSFGDTLLSIQAADTVMSPISLITSLSENEIDSLSVCVGDAVTVMNQTIEISGNGFHCASFHTDFGMCRIYNLYFAPELTQSQLSQLTLMLKSVLVKSDTGGFDALFSSSSESRNTSVLAIAEARMKAATDAMLHADWKKGARELCKLIGLGHGLTPSGDDFICGILAGIVMMNASEHPFSETLKEQLPLHFEETNDISRAFLSCALLNQFSFPVMELPHAASPDCILTAFKKIGHSSGVDTLCGIYYMCSQRDLFNN